MNNDIVYILRNKVDPDELRYSLRSVERNFPHRKVWFFGGCPNGIRPDEYVEVKQWGGTKWARSTNTIRIVCENDDVTKDFWLFNDDFFILEAVRSLPYMIRGGLQERVDALKKRGNIHVYGDHLETAMKQLQEKGFGTLDYTLHVPMLINRAKALEVLDTFPRCPMFRSLYGNYCNVGGIVTPDVKIRDDKGLPDEGQTLLSTSDGSFADGEVGKYIRSRFTERSKWEK